MVRRITPPSAVPTDTITGQGSDATVHPISEEPLPSWVHEWSGARKRAIAAAVEAARALTQSDTLDNELVATTHDLLMREISRAFARELGIAVDMLPERRLVHLHRRPPSPPMGDAS